MITKTLFGQVNQQDSYSYLLENDFLAVRILDYGATIQSFIVKPFNRDIVLGYDTLDEYVNERGTYLGATIGRVCNRIEKGCYKLNGSSYHLPINNGPNTLHGGISGFDNKVFNAEVIEDTLKLSYYSPHMEEGFNGNLSFSISFSLKEDALILSYEATCDEDTYVNFTNHSYFNLDGVGSIEQHRLFINADHCGEVDEDGLTLDSLIELYQTPLDFRRETKLALALIKDEFEQIKIAKGIDHHYLIKSEGYRLFSTLSNDSMYLKVYSDLPGMHVYTGNYISSLVGKYENLYHARAGIAFETQYYPNNINNNQLPKSILKKGDCFKHKTEFKVVLKEN